MSRWEQVEKICQSALELEESQRQAFLEQACAGDEGLRREVESLLGFEGRGEQFIEQPALEVAAKMIAHDKPESLVGQQIGSYQILSVLGAGGMGVVYQARDTRLKRLVALKVLPREKMTDPERKKRFIQEARSASALNHPNIITIYDIGSENGIDFIVMEHVSGKTLDQRIPRKGMKLHEALKLAVQMADALAKVHSAGIIHRDLKPSNVMVSDDGLVKVLDFGLAKLTEVGGGTGETLTRESLTEEGMIVGTVSYMSPEQAEGKKLDARSDIFSFGAVLYEMVTGQKAFDGDTKISTLAAIVKQEPKAITQLVPDIPPDLEKIINRCLRKDPERRFQYMGDVKVELGELKDESDSVKLTATTARVQPARRTWLWAGGGLVMVAIVAGAWLFRGPSPKTLPAPEVVPLTSYPGSERSPSFSPDGNQVAFAWNGEKQDNFDIYVKLIGSATPLQLTTNRADDINPAFSPDGRSIGFFRVSNGNTTFMTIPAVGGPEHEVATIHLTWPSPEGASFSWFPDGRWIVTDGLTLLSTLNGKTRRLTSPPGESSFDFSPAVSPDGRTIAFSRWTSYGKAEVYLLDLGKDLQPKGERRLMSSQSEYGFWEQSAWMHGGREIVLTFSPLGDSSLWRVFVSGTGQPQRLTFAEGQVSWPAISQSGGRLAYQRGVSDSNIWRLSLSGPGLATGVPERFIASTFHDAAAQYSPDNQRIAFESDRNGVRGIWVAQQDGSQPTQLFSGNCGTPRWSPDGQRVAFDFNGGKNSDIFVVNAGGGTPIALITNPADDLAPSWSADGNWVYFASLRGGQRQIWKVSAGGGEATQVTRNGGENALESPDGKYIYYVKGYISSALWKMPTSGGEESQVLPSVVLRAFFPVKDGIYFVPERRSDKQFSIQFFNLATGKMNTVSTMSAPPAEGLSVSPDGHSLLFSQYDQAGSDLMLVENFH